MSRSLRSLLVSGSTAAALIAAVAIPASHTAESVGTAATISRQPVIALVDSGVNPFHAEFNYGGPDDLTDQFVGWWDFSDDTDGHLPEAGQVWDTQRSDPFDTNGHGSATSSMAGGRNASSEKTPSFNPGGKLAMAKVGSGPDGGEITGDLAAAIRWADETVHADIISMSIGAVAPGLGGGDPVYEAISAARQHGRLVVVSNGNGLLNAGIPDPGFLTSYGNSADVLSVGAAGEDGALVTTDPEVAAEFTVQAATGTGRDTNSYQSISGTSFSAPIVAGFAARLLSEAWANGHTYTPDQLEQLIKASARDTDLPPSVEGYGIIDADQLSAAVTHARAGDVPEPDAINGLYVDTLGALLRSIGTL